MALVIRHWQHGYQHMTVIRGRNWKMLGVRVNSFNENGLGEPEQDANSALTELDKGKL